MNNTGDMHRPIAAFIPEHRLGVELARTDVTRVHSLRLGRDLRFRVRRGRVAVALPILERYDVLVFE